MENFLNILHFCFYKAHYKSHLFANKINPFRLLAETSFIKKRLEKKGIMNIHKEIDTAFRDKKNGLSTTVAGGFLFVLLFFLFFGVFGLIRKLFTTAYLEMIHFIIFGALSSVICHVFVFKKDKYIKYFDKFEKWNREEKRKYSWITFIVSIAVFCLWLLSF